jgi:hypothetical protein
MLWPQAHFLRKGSKYSHNDYPGGAVFNRAVGIRIVSHVANVFAGVGTLGSVAFNVQKQHKIIPEVTVERSRCAES